MKLTADEIFNISLGAVGVKEVADGVVLCRFTEEQSQFYKELNQNFYDKNFCPAGVKLCFKTNSEKLYIKINTKPVTSREFFSVDVFVNGESAGFLDNFSHKDMTGAYGKTKLENGDFSKEFNLGSGEKEVLVYLPALVKTLIKEISLSDGAMFEPIKPQKKLLAFGDSITQGYDALRPSNRYAARLAKKLGAEEINKGIGGDEFEPILAKLKDDFEPDYITVAYGTNDWSYRERADFAARCKEFYEAVRKNYKNAKIFAITPIWRKDYNTNKTKFGPFEGLREEIANAVKNIENATLIDGFKLVPENENLYGDLNLHPTDEGFKYYADNLYKEILNLG